MPIKTRTMKINLKFKYYLDNKHPMQIVKLFISSTCIVFTNDLQQQIEQLYLRRSNSIDLFSKWLLADWLLKKI